VLEPVSSSLPGPPARSPSGRDAHALCSWAPAKVSCTSSTAIPATRGRWAPRRRRRRARSPRSTRCRLGGPRPAPPCCRRRRAGAVEPSVSQRGGACSIPGSSPLVARRPMTPRLDQPHGSKPQASDPLPPCRRACRTDRIGCPPRRRGSPRRAGRVEPESPGLGLDQVADFADLRVVGAHSHETPEQVVDLPPRRRLDRRASMPALLPSGQSRFVGNRLR
jgi:hypothetical protein